MERRTFAVIAMAVGLALGAVGDLLFYGKQVGVSFPIFVILSVIALLALNGAAHQNLRFRNLWLVIPILFFAVMVAVRADWQIVTLDTMAVLALGALTLHYLPLSRPIDEETIVQQTVAVVETGFMIVPNALLEANDSWRWLRDRQKHGIGHMASAARGLVFTVPIVAVFGVLLVSADPVFAQYVNHVTSSFLQLFGIQYFGDTIGQAVITLGLAGVATGGLSYGVWRRVGSKSEVEALGEEFEEAKPEKRKPGFKLTMIEGGIILGSVVLLFAAFVVIQFAYFFGGRTTLGLTGLTFSDYARRGFFELLAVSILTLGLALWLDHVTIRQEKREIRLFQGLAIMLVALTTIILISAAQRMWLYEEAFGFTQLRVYTHIFMIWIGVLLIIFVLAVFRLRKNIFSLGVLLVMIGYLVTMNLVNVDAYIAERNIDRYTSGQGQELDIGFLDILSVDALPQISTLYQQSANDPKVHAWSGQWLAAQLQELDQERASTAATIFSADVSRQEAWAELDQMRATLPAFNASTYWDLVTESPSYQGDGW